MFRDRNSAYLLALFGVLVAPLIEELFFRGFLYPVLAKYLGTQVSIVLTAALFAVIHQGQLAHAWVPLAWLFVVGIILTTVRARTKSVANSVLIHIAYNATLFTLLFIATQGFQHMERA
jgi:membrane protease YdiL (CAAX protease family)